MSSEFDKLQGTEDDIPALEREWAVTRIAIAVSVVLVIGVLAYVTFFMPGVAPPPGETGADQQAATANSADAAAQGHQVCSLALANAQNFGIVPSFTKIGDGQPKHTDVTGRYVCNAATEASHYALAVDLVCSDLTNAKCVNLYSVAQDDGTVLYQRHDPAPDKK